MAWNYAAEESSAITGSVKGAIVQRISKTCAQCTAYTAVSRGLADANQPLTDVEIEIVRNAVDCARFTPPKTSGGGRPIIAWAGRTSDPQKDFARFTRIAAALTEE